MAVPPPPVGHRGIWNYKTLISLWDHIYGKDDEEITLNAVLDYFAGKDELPQANKEANKDTDSGEFNYTNAVRLDKLDAQIKETISVKTSETHEIRICNLTTEIEMLTAKNAKQKIEFGNIVKEMKKLMLMQRNASEV